MNPIKFDAVEGFTMPLPAGELVTFRPIRLQDRQIIEHGMSALSTQTRYFRFFTPISKLTNAQLNYFTEVDQDNHVAWIALDQNQSRQTGLGIARYILTQHQPKIAEFALVVIDSYQRRGLGTMLLAILYKMAVIKGVETLRATLLLENSVMSKWLTNLGALGKYENGVFIMDLAILNNWSVLAESDSVQHFKDCIESIHYP